MILLLHSDEEMYELLKAKRAADTQFRKIKLAYEGPKNPSRSKSSAADKKKEADTGEAKEADEPSSGKKGSKENKENKTEDEEKTEAAPKFKPTATKKQFVSACWYAASVLHLGVWNLIVSFHSFCFTGCGGESSGKGPRCV